MAAEAAGRREEAESPAVSNRCLDDPHLFGPSFAQGDWAAWRVFIAALFAEGAPTRRGWPSIAPMTGRTAWPSRPSARRR